MTSSAVNCVRRWKAPKTKIGDFRSDGTDLRLYPAQRNPCVLGGCVNYQLPSLAMKRFRWTKKERREAEKMICSRVSRPIFGYMWWFVTGVGRVSSSLHKLQVDVVRFSVAVSTLCTPRQLHRNFTGCCGWIGCAFFTVAIRVIWCVPSHQYLAFFMVGWLTEVS